MRNFLILTSAAGLLAVCLVATGAGQGDIYRWKDVNGNWHYSDQPQAGAELVRGTRKPPSTPAAAAPAAATTSAALTPGAPGADSKVADQVRQDVAAAQEENCKKADESYNQAVQARRMYKLDAQGVKTYLTDAELDEKRVNARIQRDAICKR